MKQLELDMEQQTGSKFLEKGVHQGRILSPLLFHFYAEYIMQNPGLNEITSWNQDSWEKYQQPQICK